MLEPLVRVDRASLHFGSAGDTVRAVNDVSCVVRAGDRIAITGPSGSGKSCLLSLMAGLETPTLGTVKWPATGSPQPLRPRHIAMAFQTQTLLPALTVYENVEIPLLILCDNQDAESRIHNLLRIFDLDHLADRLPEELSGGQAQRVGLARALVTNPGLVLADEPTGQLDQSTGQTAIDSVLAYLHGSSSALVIATHDLAVARRMQTNWRMSFGHLNSSPAEATL